MFTPILAQMDLPNSIWLFYPIFIFGNHNSLGMTLVQLSGLILFGFVAVRLMLKQKVQWEWKRLAIFALYPVIVFGTNMMGLVFRQF